MSAQTMQSAEIAVPGKVMLFGEYAVLDGAEALLVPVARFARCCVKPRMQSPAESEVRLLLPDGQKPFEPLASYLLAQFPQISCCYEIDLTAFFAPSGKLGLGSSAAAAVALARALFAQCGESPSVQALFAAAQKAHRMAQGVGSGADIAVCALQAPCRYRWHEAQFTGEIQPLKTPLLESIDLVATRQPASTSRLVLEMKAYAERAPKTYAMHAKALSEAELAGRLALESGHFVAVGEAMTQGREALQALTRDSKIPLWSEVHQTLAKILDPLHVPLKPTGAGQGDLLWIWPSDRGLVQAALSAAGFELLSLPVVRT